MNGDEFLTFRQFGGRATWGMWCALLLLATACEKQPAYTPPPPPQVTMVQPVRQNVTDSLELTGNTRAAPRLYQLPVAQYPQIVPPSMAAFMDWH